MAHALAQNTLSVAIGTPERCVLVNIETGMVVSPPKSLDNIVKMGRFTAPAQDYRALVPVAELALSRSAVGKFNPHHDPKNGQFTTGPAGAGSSGRGVEFISPERRTGRSITEAKADLSLAQQSRLKAAQRVIHERLGMAGAVSRDGIGVWTDPTAGIGAEASTMVTTSRTATLEQLTVAASMAGWLTEQKGVIAFKPSPRGHDMMMSMQGLRGTPEALYRSFAERGVENITLVPRRDGLFDAHTIALHAWGGEDAQNATMDSFNAVAKARGAQTTYTNGDGAYVGADTREDARKEYERVIDQHRPTAVVTPRTRGESRDGGRDRLGWWDDLARKWRTGQTNRKEPLAKRVGAQIVEVLDAVRERLIEKFNPHHRPAGPGGGQFTTGPAGLSFAAASAMLDGETTRRSPAGSAGSAGTTLLAAQYAPTTARQSRSVFAPETAATRLTYRNMAVDALFADAAVAGTLKTKLTDAQIRETASSIHPTLATLDDDDITAIRKSYAKLKVTLKDTQLANWDHVLPLYENGKDVGATWYNSSHLIDTAFGDDAPTFRMFLAVTSPNTALQQNLTKGLSYYVQWMANGRRPPADGFKGGTGMESDSAVKLLNEGVARGSKVGQFVAAMGGDTDAVVVDVWMARAFGLNQASSPTDREFRIVSRIVTAKARAMGVSPSALQAGIWVGAKRASEGPDTEVRGFAELLLDRAKNTPMPAVRGRGDARRYALPVPADTDLHGMISATSVKTWERVREMAGGGTMLRRVRDALLTTVKSLAAARTDLMLQLYAGMVCLDVRGDREQWSRRIDAELPNAVVSWDDAKAGAAWWLDMVTFIDETSVTKYNPYHRPAGPGGGQFTSRTGGGGGVYAFNNATAEHNGYLPGGAATGVVTLHSDARTPAQRAAEKSFNAAAASMPDAMRERINKAQVYFVTPESGGMKEIGFYAAYSPQETWVYGHPFDAMINAAPPRPVSAGDSFLLSGPAWTTKRGISRGKQRDAIMRHEMGHMLDRMLLEQKGLASAHPYGVFSETGEGHARIGPALRADLAHNKRLGRNSIDTSDPFLRWWAQSQNADGAIVLSAAEQFADSAAYLFGAQRIRQQSAIRLRRTFPHTIRAVAKMIEEIRPDIAKGFKRRVPELEDIERFATRVGKVDDADGPQYVLGPASAKSALLAADGTVLARIETPDAWDA